MGQNTQSKSVTLKLGWCGTFLSEVAYVAPPVSHNFALSFVLATLAQEHNIILVYVASEWWVFGGV